MYFNVSRNSFIEYLSVLVATALMSNGSGPLIVCSLGTARRDGVSGFTDQMGVAVKGI